MVHLVDNENAFLLYWIISGGALFSFVGLVVACICSCRRNDNKSEFLDLAGMVKMTNTENETFNRLSSTEALQTIAQDTVDSIGKRSNTANRSLPDIPKDKNAEDENAAELQEVIYEATANVSELYATVSDKNLNKLEKSSKVISQQSSQDDSSLYARLKTPQTSTEEHPYAQVHNVSKAESVHNSSNLSNVDSAKPSTSGLNVSSNPVAPPRSRRSSSHNSVIEHVSQGIQAASAISGGVHASQELPYMTPPLLHLQQHPEPATNSPQQQHFSGDSQDSSKGYTSISVREPLANIIAQTKNAQRQSPKLLTDPHYATVSDDSDEMYAAIDEQDKLYTSGSETYAQIQPVPANPVREERVESNRQISEQVILRTEELHSHVPQPPSVNSLRHAAQVHSRQASSSSATSSVINPSSPKPEKRSANSPLPPPPENPMDLYAVVDKRNKSEPRPSTLSAGKSLEDMYAKVIKKKRDSEDVNSHALEFANSVVLPTNLNSLSQPSGTNLLKSNRLSWSSHESMDVQKRESVLQNGELSESADADYETLRPTYGKRSQNSGSVTPIYSQPFKPANRQMSDASSEDPGYERVRVRRRVIEQDLDTDSEPNYESMPHDPVEPNYASVGSRAGDSDIDPNYESVNNGDPNYESVKYMSLDRGATDDAVEPPYEQVSNLKRGSYSRNKTDSDYERIENFSEIPNGNDHDDQRFIKI